jgi:hypothetical protein
MVGTKCSCSLGKGINLWVTDRKQRPTNTSSCQQSGGIETLDPATPTLKQWVRETMRTTLCCVFMLLIPVQFLRCCVLWVKATYIWVFYSRVLKITSVPPSEKCFTSSHFWWTILLWLKISWSYDKAEQIFILGSSFSCELSKEASCRQLSELMSIFQVWNLWGRYSLPSFLPPQTQNQLCEPVT